MNKNNENIYFDGTSYYCKKLYSDISGDLIVNHGFLMKLFSLNGRSEIVFCTGDELIKIKSGDKSIPDKYNKRLYEYVDVIIIIISYVIPKGSTIVTIQPPQVRDSRNAETVFSIANKQLDNETTTDKSRFAGRIEFMKEEGSLSIEERDQKLLDRDSELNTKLSDSTVYNYLSELQSCEKLISFKKVNLLKSDKQMEFDNNE